MPKSDTSKLYEITTGPFTVFCPGPESVEVYDKDGGSGECLKDAVTYLILHSHNPTLHTEFSDVIEKLTGIKREVDADATAKAKARAKEGAKVSDVLEKATAYFKRVMATAGVDTAAVHAAVKAAALNLYIDPTPGRSSGPSAYFLKIADSLLARDEAALAKKLAFLADAAPDFQLEYEADGKPNRESLASFIKTATEV